VKEVGTRCDAETLEERCLMAVSDCGAREMRFRWTAPELWQRAIWFSAGVVATDSSTDTPDADAVTEVSFPLTPAASASAHYESVVQHNCSLGARGGSDHALRPVLGAMLWIGVLSARVHARRARGRC
jgi:hypothetical protein